MFFLDHGPGSDRARGIFCPCLGAEPVGVCLRRSLALAFEFDRQIRSRLLALLGIAAAGLSGCGGGFYNPPPADYTLTITAASGSVQSTMKVVLTID